MKNGLPVVQPGRLDATDKTKVFDFTASVLKSDTPATSGEVANKAYVDSLVGTANWGGITGTLSNQTDLQAALDAKTTGNAPISGATKTKVTYDTKGLITAGADATTADIADSADKRYVTDAELVVLGNTSGVNTGDQNLSAYALKADPLSQFGATTSLQLKGVISDETGSGALVFATSPALVTPDLGTPTALVGTNITGTASGLTAGNVTTNANLTGDVTSSGNATTLTNAPVIAKVLTGYVSGAGVVAATDSILQAIQKLNGNDATNANLTGAVTSVGNATSLGSFSSSSLAGALTDETGSGAAVFANTPTLVTPALGAATGTSIVLSSFLNEAKGADVASNTTTNIGAATGNYINVTGTTTITAFDTVQAGTRRIVQFSGALTLTNNAAIILPGGVNITTVAGDTATFVSLGSGNWICTNYQKVTITGTGSAVQATSPTLVTPNLGTPSTLVGTNISGTASSLTAGHVTTNANLTGAVTSSGNATSLGSFASSDLATALTDETGSGAAVFGTTPTLATPVINGLPTGTGVASAATASTLMSRDGNKNTRINNIIEGYTTTATAAGTTTLAVGDTFLQFFTGSTTQIVALPVASTLVLGQQFLIVNNSSGAVTVNSSGGNLVQTLAGGSSATITCILVSGTDALSWSSLAYSSSSGLTQPQVMARFLGV